MFPASFSFFFCSNFLFMHPVLLHILVAKLKLFRLRQAYKLTNKIVYAFFVSLLDLPQMPRNQIAYQLRLSYFIPLDMTC